MAIIWLSASFGYYLISYQLKYIQGDFWLNGIVSSSSELLADAIAGVLLNVFGIRLVISTSFFLSFLGMISLIFYTGNESIWFSVFVLGSKFGISSAFNAAYCSNVILFPVGILSTTFGICNFAARITTIAAPYVAELIPEWIPRGTFCIFVFVAFLAANFINEPKRQRAESEAPRWATPVEDEHD